MIDVRHGDSRDVLKTMADASIDSCVTDPPYALVSIVKRFGKNGSAPAQDGASGVYKRASAGFMGQQWDTGETAFDPDFWAEVWRVLKPGAHLLAFSGTRTYHRMVCAIEDAGFEIRDSIFYCYGSGFPKSHNVSKRLFDAQECCSCDKDMRGLRSSVDAEDEVSGIAKQDLRGSLRGLADWQESAGKTVATQSASHGGVFGLREGEDDTAGLVAQSENADVLKTMQWKTARGRVEATRAQRLCSAQNKTGHADGEKPGMEGRHNFQEAAWELQGRSLCASAGVGKADGAQGRLHHGASACDGADVRVSFDENGSGQSHRPQSSEQSSEQFGTLPDERGSQAWGGWPFCRGCGKPIIAQGLGTALKPAVEPIVVARKPLIGTVAANVMAHGTGALNIDGCRVATEEDQRRPSRGGDNGLNGTSTFKIRERRIEDQERALGRWPANLVHDGSPEVLACFPDAGGGYGVRGTSPNWGPASGDGGTLEQVGFGDAGSAARFFYTAKADASDRLGSKHPTVKPVDLMRWLCRLVTPPGGTVLDPFAGSGTTGMACMAEGFDALLIEREANFVEDIKRRIAHVKGEDAPLFASEVA